MNVLPISENPVSTAEYVSAGHPDRVADIIAAKLISLIQAKDGENSHAAIEVMLTGKQCIFAGEAITSFELSADLLRKTVNEAFNQAGYYPEMRHFWTKDEVTLAKDIGIINLISIQSPDIAMATTDKGEESGWNDQTLVYSSCDNSNPLGLGYPMFLAKLISDKLIDESRYHMLEVNLPKDFARLGPDNKVLVSVEMKEDGFTPDKVVAVTIAVAHTANYSIANLKHDVKKTAKDIIESKGIHIADNCEWIINGTGRFVVHGCQSDTGLTGRKISVNHPSASPLWSNKLIGGGSLVKPWHASDLLLNISARFIANVIVKAALSDYAVVGLSGAIGQSGLQSIYIYGDEKFRKIAKQVETYFIMSYEWAPAAIAKLFELLEPYFDFSDIVETNFFGSPLTQPWEDPKLIEQHAKFLKTFLEKNK